MYRQERRSHVVWCGLQVGRGSLVEDISPAVAPNYQMLHTSTPSHDKWQVSCRHTKVQWLSTILGRRLISPAGLPASADAKQRGKVEQWRRHAPRRIHPRLDGQSPLVGAPAGLQWPRNMTAMASLVRTRSAEKSVEGAREQIIRDPDVRGRRGIERLHCTAAGNGRASHQAWWACGW